MIHLFVTQDDLLKIRFSYSPLLELICSYRALYSKTSICALGYHTEWTHESRRVLSDVELPYLESLVNFKGYIPDFLTPTPVTRNLTLEDEIACVLETPIEVIREDVQVLIDMHGSSTIRQFVMAYPRESLFCIVDELRLYWKRVLEPHWSQIISILEGDMLHHGRIMALDGAQTMLEKLTPSVRYYADDRELQLQKDTYNRVYHLDGQGIQFLPGMFISPEHVTWMINPRYRPLVMYSARGAGMWKQSVPESNESLELALGAGRARVLIALILPRNTGELARLLDISSGAVSQHLARLHQAGLVEPRRVGKRVFYHLTDRGENLIALFNVTP